MPTRSIAGDADRVEVSGLLWCATGCLDGAFPSEGLTLAADHPLRRSGTPGVLRDLWGDGPALVAKDGGLRLQAREIAAVHEALVAAWRMRRSWRRGGCGATGRRAGRGGRSPACWMTRVIVVVK